jgi:hypothetical protein
MYSPKCPTCQGVMWNDYDSWMGGKDYYWKCSKKKKHNPSCLDKERYWECDKCSKIKNDCTCLKKEGEI